MKGLFVTSAVTIVGPRDAKLEELVRASGRVTVVTWLADLSTLVDPKAAQPDVLLVDVRRDASVPPQLAALKRQHPTTNVVLLAAALDPALMLEGMRAGVSECIAEPLRQADIDAALNRLLGHHSNGPARVFAFVGAKGGVGTTTTAVNVATAIAKLSPGSTLLMDLHLAYGDAGIFLGVDARFSVLDALENLHRLDAQFLKSLVCRTAAGLELLASADRPATRLLDVRRLGSVIQLAASQYTYTVLDVPRSDLTVLDTLDDVPNVVVVANQELATVRNAGRMAAALRARYPKATVTTVINRTDRRSEINQQDVEKVVGAPIAHQVPSDYRRALLAMNKGRPLALDNHNELAASFTALARDLTGLEHKKTERSGSGGFKGFLSGRR